MSNFKKYSLVLLTCFINIFNFASAKEKNEKNEKEIENLSIPADVIYLKEEKPEKENPESALIGKFAISGNAIIFSKTKNLENYGQLIGLLEARGDEVFDNTLGGAIVTDGQGNGVASTAFSSFANKQGGVDRKIPKLLNNNLILGSADLEGGEAEVHGSVEGTSTGNGVLVYGLADYGLILGSDGAGGSIGEDSSDSDDKLDTKAGASKIKAKHKDKEYKDKHKKERKIKDKYKEKHKEKYKEKEKNKKKEKNNKTNKYKIGSDETDFGKSNLDGKAGATVSGGSSKPKSGIISHNPDTNLPEINKTDITGKNANVSISDLKNNGKILADLNVKTKEGYMRPSAKYLNPDDEVEVEEHNQPQWRSILISASGNGVITNTFVTSPTRQNFSTEAKNYSTIDKIENNGEIEGKADLRTGDTATINYVNTFAVANGISLSAYSDNNVGHHTKTELNTLKNIGKILGNLNQIAGENTGTGFHEYSTSESTASGNGVSLFSRSSNAKNKMTESHIRNIENLGIISGELYSKAGNGNGNIYAKSKSSGNGIAVYSTGGEKNITSIDSIFNRGIISGKAVLYAGKDLPALYSGKEDKRYEVEIIEKTRNENLEDTPKIYEANTYNFTADEIAKGTATFEAKREKENKKFDTRISEFKEQLSEIAEDYEKLEKIARTKEDLLEKISSTYLVRLTKGKEENAIEKKDIDKGIQDLQVKIKEQEDLMKWNADKEPFQKKIKELKENLAYLELEKENLENKVWDKINIKEALISYDEKISKKEEEIDSITKESEKKIENVKVSVGIKETEIKRKEEEIKKVELQLASNKFPFGQTKASVTKKKERLEREKLKLEEEKIRIKSQIIEIENVAKENKKIKEEEIKKLKEDLQDEEIQDFLTVIERKDYTEKTIAYLEQLKKRNIEKENPMTKKKDNEDRVIDATVEFIATGNGISINQDGRKNEEYKTLSYFKNEGVISGYAEVYRGQEDNEYSRVGYRSSGAGFSVKGEMPTEIKNAGIISGNEFALLAQGNKNVAYGNAIYESGFNKVTNYGILAGRVIVGGYKEEPSSPQVYEYFETIYSDKNKHKNQGLYLVLDKLGEVEKVITGEMETLSDRGKLIINISEIEGKYDFSRGAIENKIINGVGKLGVVSISDEKNIKDSIINGFYTTLKLEDNSYVILKNSLINTNGFGDKSYAILGSDGNDKVNIDNKTLLNGKVDLKDGNDTLELVPRLLFQEIELGKGLNTLRFIGEEREDLKNIRLFSTSNETEEKDNTYNIRVLNANHLEVLENSTIDKNSKITGIEKISIEKDKKLVYRMVGKNNQPFEDLFVKDYKEDSEVQLYGQGDFFVEDSLKKYSVAGKSSEILGWKLVRNNEEVYLESEAILNARNRLGISKREFLSLTDNQPIKMVNSYLVLSKIYNNLNAMKSYATVENLSTHSKHLLDARSFISKGKMDTNINIFGTRSKTNSYKNKVNMKVANLNYGVSENINLGTNLSIGTQKIENNKKELKSDIISLGLETIFKKDNLFWYNAYTYSFIKSKESKKDTAHILNTMLKYNIPISNNWRIVPKVSLLYGKTNQNSKIEKIENEQGENIGKIYIPKSKQDYLEWNVGLSLIGNKRIGQQNLSFEIGSEYTNPKSLKDIKITQTERTKTEELKNDWKLRSPEMKNTLSIFTGMKYKNESGISLELKLRKNNKNLKNISLGIGYIF